MVLRIAALSVVAGVPLTAAPPAPTADNATRVARVQYLVNTSGCHDCRTPLKMGAKGPEPDMKRMLSGHPEEG